MRLSGFVALPLAALLASAHRPAPTASPAPPLYEVYAVRYATLHFPKSALIRTAPRGEMMDIAMTVWLLKGSDGRIVLFDAGYYRDKFQQQYKSADYVTAAEAIGRIGVKPEQVNDVIISHIHWDHADGADLFPTARVWIQKEEYAFYIDSTGTPRNRTIDALDAAMFAQLDKAGRVMRVDGDAKEIIPGITVYTGGKHTYASQFISVPTRSGTVVLASDNAYLYENLDNRVPIAQTAQPADTISNLQAQDRMATIAASRKFIVPGHDMLVFSRFPKVAEGVVRID
jgi:glyoxylase-like metal-dependent hydrolase (beta-lactamase superfamily II)